MAKNKLIYNIEVKDGVFLATDQKGVIRKQLHDIADVYTYKENTTLGTPQSLKIVAKYGDELELDVENTASISGVAFTGDFDALLSAVNALLDTINSINVTAALDPNAATLAEQQAQTVELGLINVELDLQTTEAEQTNEYLIKKEEIDRVYFDLAVNQFGPNYLPFPRNLTDITISGGGAIPNEAYNGLSITNNTIEDFINTLNVYTVGVKFELKGGTEIWINDGTESAAAWAASGGSFNLKEGPSISTTFLASSFSTISVLPASLSNLDEILVLADNSNTLLTQQAADVAAINAKTSDKNTVQHVLLTNPSTVNFSNFKRLSFVCDGAITVAAVANIVYPITFANGDILRGGEFTASYDSSTNVSFNGTGIVIVTLQN